MQGVLEPGEAIEILLSIRADGGKDSTAEVLTTAPGRKLDAILVLRVQEGNDIFCSITGTYQPSFFGLPLPLLASLPRQTLCSLAQSRGMRESVGREISLREAGGVCVQNQFS